MPAAPATASEIRISGTVQGVGFRPTVWRLAREEGLLGEVLNDGQGVLIRTVGSAEAIHRLIIRLQAEAPVLAHIESVAASPMPATPNYSEFRIVDSIAGQNQTRIAADAAICSACRDEVLNPLERRHAYPFTNCTHCGPRFSIIQRVPYDRPHTTMAGFALCPDCAKEYADPADRRFHAQPIACAICGPSLWTEQPGSPHANLSGTLRAECNRQAINTAVACIQGGGIVAMRGLGGFHLICDARHEGALARLRLRKRRDAKPLALMARDIDMIKRYCQVPEAAVICLQSVEAPIVVLDAIGAERLPEAIAPGLDQLGFMLPYTPLHVLFLQAIDGPLVMTSANHSSAPQVIDNQEARDKLAGIADLFLMHDRDIANRIDDSVIRVAFGRRSVLRRARGYAPAAIPLPEGFAGAPAVLALGAELKSTFCLIQTGAAVLSQHQGDLEDLATYEDYQKNLRLYAAIYDHRPECLAVDLHPEYLSRKLGLEFAEAAHLPVAAVQHHHAHFASCLGEHRVPRKTEAVLGLVLDGLGMGEDGSFWGGELLLGDYANTTRLGSLQPTPMLGGMRAILEPWRNTFAHLRQALPWSQLTAQFGDLPLLQRLRQKPLAAMERMLAANLNCPLASSCGRLFDAVAAALGCCFDQVAYEGQAAMALETLALRAGAPHEAHREDYRLTIQRAESTPLLFLNPGPMWQRLLEDLSQQVSIEMIAARFHRGLAQALTDLVVAALANMDGAKPNTIALSGGCVQNAYLLEALHARLSSLGLQVLRHEQVPANDGGIALGQALVAAARALAAAELPHLPASERSTTCA